MNAKEFFEQEYKNHFPNMEHPDHGLVTVRIEVQSMMEAYADHKIQHKLSQVTNAKIFEQFPIDGNRQTDYLQLENYNKQQGAKWAINYLKEKA